MKYNEFIHLNEDFVPVFDLQNEESDKHWSLFLPNHKFHTVLSAVIDSLNISNQKKPVWLQGTYGTGKSHATSVIKHLLCDEEIPNNFDLEEKQLTDKLNNFRKKNKVVPIVLKGTSNIRNSSQFKLTIQTAVKKSLEKQNMRVAVPSEFEHMISIIDEIPLTEDDVKGTLLELVSGKEEIKNRLRNHDSKILMELEDILHDKKGIGLIANESIVDWLIQVKKELYDNYGVNYLIIFWDEFTGALSLPNANSILLDIQNIAEAKHEGISLFIVSHRTRSNQVDDELLKKILDRFERITYSMSPTTTYQLMEKSIDKDEEKWVKEKDRFAERISPIIKEISNNQGPKVEKALENLYPIHPYTSFLATFIAREIGSTERSIFTQDFMSLMAEELQ